MPKTPSQHRFVQTVLTGRAKFIAPAQRLFFSALQAQINPVAKKLITHYQAHSMDHLIKEDALVDGFKKVYSKVGNHFGRAVYDSLMATDKRLKDDDDDFDMDAAIEEFIKKQGGVMITAITKATRERVRDYIAEAIKNGTGAAQLAADFKKDFSDFNRVRSMAIARTEVGRASNWASYEAGNMTGMELEKTWLHAGSSKDDRETHVAASGQTVAYEDTFEIDGSYAPMYPQDGSGDASEEVNCNCTFYQKRVGSKY